MFYINKNDTLHKHTLTETHLPVTLIPASSFTNACAWHISSKYHKYKAQVLQGWWHLDKPRVKINSFWSRCKQAEGRKNACLYKYIRKVPGNPGRD